MSRRVQTPSLSQKTLEAMCRDQWHWQTKNPTGYV